MALTELLKKPLQFIMFGGKGGVGKTTMAAASSLAFAKDKKVLIFTTDPAPSLADSFGQEIGNEPTAVRGVKNLFAMEIDAKKVLEEFKGTKLKGLKYIHPFANEIHDYKHLEKISNKIHNNFRSKRKYAYQRKICLWYISKEISRKK